MFTPPEDGAAEDPSLPAGTIVVTIEDAAAAGDRTDHAVPERYMRMLDACR